MNAAAEIEFLERLYSMPSEEELEQMKEDPEPNRLAAQVIAESEVAAERVGKDGLHCYFYGFDVPSSTCRWPSATECPLVNRYSRLHLSKLQPQWESQTRSQ